MRRTFFIAILILLAIAVPEKYFPDGDSYKDKAEKRLAVLSELTYFSIKK